MTGSTVWTTKELSDPAGYSSVIAADVQGVRTYMTFTAAAGVGVRASDGKLMFRYPRAANGTANITTPIFSDDKVFFTSAYGTGGGLLQLSASNGDVAASTDVAAPCSGVFLRSTGVFRPPVNFCRPVGIAPGLTALAKMP